VTCCHVGYGKSTYKAGPYGVVGGAVSLMWHGGEARLTRITLWFAEVLQNSVEMLMCAPAWWL